MQIANQFPTKDLNSDAVLSYSVEHLEVKRILVVGHTGCGGVKGAVAVLAQILILYVVGTK